MKKLISIMLAGIILLGVTGCNNKDLASLDSSEANETETTKVISNSFAHCICTK